MNLDLPGVPLSHIDGEWMIRLGHGDAFFFQSQRVNVKLIPEDDDSFDGPFIAAASPFTDTRQCWVCKTPRVFDILTTWDSAQFQKNKLYLDFYDHILLICQTCGTSFDEFKSTSDPSPAPAPTVELPQSAAELQEVESGAVGPKLRRSRPPKTPLSAADAASPPSSASASASASGSASGSAPSAPLPGGTAPHEGIKRKRGRPPKAKPSQESSGAAPAPARKKSSSLGANSCEMCTLVVQSRLKVVGTMRVCDECIKIVK